MQTSAFNMEEDDPQINIINVPDHDHPDDGDVISSSAIIERMTQAIENDPSKPVKRIYDEVVGDATEDERHHIPAFSHVRSKLNRKRLSLLPPTKHSADKLCIEHEWEKTWYG